MNERKDINLVFDELQLPKNFTKKVFVKNSSVKSKNVITSGQKFILQLILRS